MPRREPLLAKEELADVKSLIDDFKPRIGYFERRVLVPGVSGRLDYIAEIFRSFQQICVDRNLAITIDAAVRRVANPQIIEIDLPEPRVGEQYLRKIHEMLETNFLQPIQALQEQYPLTALPDADVDWVTNYLNDAKILFDSILGAREKMFMYSVRAIVNVRTIATGEVVLGPPVELALILTPFETRLGELISVSTSTSDSIRVWGDKIKDQQNRHLEMISHLAQIKVAKEQTSATRKNILFQMCVIVFTIVLVILSQPVNTYIEKKVIEGALDKKGGEVKTCLAQTEIIKNGTVENEKELNRKLQECIKSNMRKPNRVKAAKVDPSD